MSNGDGILTKIIVLNRGTQEEPITENNENKDLNDAVSEMILTNEVTLPVNHTESTDVNENYMNEILNLTASTESSTQFDQTTNPTVIENATDASSELRLSNIISVICIWC